MERDASPKDSAAAERPIAYPVAALAEALAADVAHRQQERAAGRALGAVSGIKRLDSMLCGAFAPGLHVLQGTPGVGKTAFALGLALDCGCPALFVTCELSPLELLRRMVARVTRTYLGKLKNGDPNYSAETLRRDLASTVDAAAHLVILDATTAPASLADIGNGLQIARVNPADTSSPHALIVLDSIHTWASSLPDDGEEYSRLTSALNDLDTLARKAGAALVGIAEQNRFSQNQKGEGGNLQGAAGTRRFEYVAETMLELRKRDKDPDKEDRDGWRYINLHVTKNRNGETGIIPMQWHGGMQRHRQEGE